MDPFERRIRLDERGTITVADRGYRAPLLFVHGFPLDHTIWEEQLAVFARQRRVLAPDLVGFGTSTGAVRASVNDHADDLAGLLDALGIQRAVPVALSMGGYVTLALWRRHRERIAGMVLACSRAGPDAEASRAARYQMAISVERKGVASIADALLPRLMARSAPESLRIRLRDVMHRQPPEGVIAALKAMAARPSARGELVTIDVPTLVIAGDQDEVIPVASSVAIADAIPGSRLEIVPGAGHLVPLEAPDAFHRVLASFLDDVDAA